MMPTEGLALNNEDAQRQAFPNHPKMVPRIVSRPITMLTANWAD